jgi:hypothetical protein
VVKLKSPDVPVVAAQDATAASFAHQDRLDITSSLRDALGPAAFASVVAASLDHELGPAVT